MRVTENNAVKGIRKVMLDCETATFLITKHEYDSLSCAEKAKLQIHLATCKFCRRFKKQSGFLSKINKENILPDKNNLRLHLSDDQKEKMKKKLFSAEK